MRNFTYLKTLISSGADLPSLIPFILRNGITNKHSKHTENEPLYFDALCPVDVIALSVCGETLCGGWRSWFVVLGIFGKFEAFGLLVWFIAELHQSHSHGQTQTPHQDIEHASHVTETQRTGLILQGETQLVQK